MLKTALRCAAASLCALATVAVIIAADIGASVSAQSDEQSGRIVARSLDDGRTEFGWQPSDGKRVLPTNRYFPANVDHGRWLRSSSVEVDGKTIGRINARLADDGRIEFAFTPTGGERILPSLRYFPTDALVGRWLRSTEITWSIAPRFIAVSAGDFHTCGLRDDGSVQCWGNYSADQINAPEGRFSAISVGGVGFPPGVRTNIIFAAICGLRDSGVIQCWGRTMDGDVPAGRFSAVSAGGYHICGLREGGSVECWGSNYDGQTDAPGGMFSAVSAGWLHTCGLRESGTVVCWRQALGRIRHDPPLDRGQADPPDGRFSAVSAGDFHTCGCWKTARSNAGETTSAARQMLPKVASPRSAPAARTPADCASRAPLSVGELTVHEEEGSAGTQLTMVKPTLPTAASPRSAPGGPIHAACARTAPSNVGATTRPVNPTPLRPKRCAS